MTKTQFDDKLRRISRELRKLEGTESPISRRNARKRVLSSMRALRAAVDEAFPAIVDRTGVKRLKTFAGRLARLQSAGWCAVHESKAARFALSGVAVKKLRHVEHNTDGNDIREAWLVPRWARAIGDDPVRLREAKKSVKIRSAAIVAEALGNGGP